MVKRKQKKVIKQKQKQNVNVKQNVKVVIGDVKKRKQVRKSSGAKAGASAKPPIVLNISNPQPPNNMFIEYFKQQLQNQQPVHAPTLNQFVTQEEKEENKASRAGLLHKLDQEPNDVARELRRQRVEGIERFKKAEAERKAEEKAMAGSLKKIPKETKSSPKVVKPQKTPTHYFMPSNPFELINQEENEEQEEEEVPATITPESAILRELEQQRSRMEREIERPSGAGSEVPQQEEEKSLTITPKKGRRGRPRGSKNKPKK